MRKKETSLAEGNQKYLFFCYSVLLYSPLFIM